MTQVGDKVEVEGALCVVRYVTRENRAIVDAAGVYLVADRNPDGIWEQSGEPARGDEMRALEALLAPTNDVTVTTVTTVTR